MKILVCTDGSENSRKCLNFTARMAGSCDINEITVLHVHENRPLLPDYWQGGYPFSAEEKQQLLKMDRRLREQQEKHFTGLDETFAGVSARVSSLFKVGHPAEEIAREAEKGGYDLVVIGQRGRGGVKKLFLGSVSNAVLQAVKTNVTIVKE